MPSSDSLQEGGVRRSRMRVPSAKNVFGQQRDRIKRRSERILDGIYNGRRRAIHGQLADSLGTEGAMYVSEFLEINPNRREIGGSRHDVVGHLTVLHAPSLPNDFFVQGVTDSLRDATDDLSAGEDWMKHFSHFLQGNEVIDVDAVGHEIHRDFRNVDSP